MNYQYAINEPLSLRLYSSSIKTGFSYRILKKNYTCNLGHTDYNHLLFLIEGEMHISCNEFIDKPLKANNFVLIPIAADVICKAFSDCTLIIFSFEQFFNTKSKYSQVQLQKLSRNIEYEFNTLPFCESLERYLNNIIQYIHDGFDSPELEQIKLIELQIILQEFYTAEDIAGLFYPLIGDSPGFRTKVLRSYRKVNHVDELAKLLNMEKRTFTRYFNEEFGVSPYQWLLDRKAKHIYFSIAESDDSLEKIRQYHGFRFAGHFTRFCKEYFNCTPLKLRRKLRWHENIL